MNNSFCYLTNLPGLPASFVDDGLDNNGFVYHSNPHIIHKPSQLFHKSRLKKIMEKQFGPIRAGYVKNPPNSLYDWHRDLIRVWSLNWIVKSSAAASAFYRHNHNHKLFWDLEQIVYSTEHPTLLDTQQEHCVFNNHNEERVILSVSCVEDHSYQEAKEFLCSINLSSDELFGTVD